MTSGVNHVKLAQSKKDVLYLLYHASKTSTAGSNNIFAMISIIQGMIRCL